ncbi:hypothetical protein V8G54_036334 [Vigna mungo]|uniref:Uncharacterized protein n=1 Tax=Vigna mungo TaxID=3915 RepID=A0AAQ3RGH1_VIGMU
MLHVFLLFLVVLSLVLFRVRTRCRRVRRPITVTLTLFLTLTTLFRFISQLLRLVRRRRRHGFRNVLKTLPLRSDRGRRRRKHSPHKDETETHYSHSCHLHPQSMWAFRLPNQPSYGHTSIQKTNFLQFNDRCKLFELPPPSF